MVLACSAAAAQALLEGVHALLYASPVSLKAAVGSDTAAPQSRTQLWLDFRQCSNLKSSKAAVTDEVPVPDVQAVLLELFNGVRNTLAELDYPMPQGQGVDAVLVEDKVAAATLEQAEASGGFPVFGMRTMSTSDGSRLVTRCGNDILGQVYDAATGELVGGLSVPPSARSQEGLICKTLQVWGPGCYGDNNAVRSGSEVEPMAQTMPRDPLLWAMILSRYSKGTESHAAEGQASS
eukprot:CAMPEP_0172768370 /NCGR_PEP_ID=MMETSP1074-20121228/184618_1 /TAXON_ID=2916 /ORGANISM="Ceratium fusus, Strain PA161109" /LENGTH=235 /DNA_ID=CAMNT_0013603757 /DNA_START=85 /DNA_END=793 /DNA_ORIENTATION=+